jgi:hypothetical protein
MSNRHAERLIAASGVINNLRPCGRVLPATEHHVRHLTKLTEDKQGAAGEMVLEAAPDGKVMEALVYKIVKDMLPQPPPKPKFVSPPSTPESPSTGDANYFTNMAISRPIESMITVLPCSSSSSLSVIVWARLIPKISATSILYSPRGSNRSTTLPFFGDMG